MAETSDEWEYEYDESETNDFYITVDLSNIPDEGKAVAPNNRELLSNHTAFLQTRLRAPSARQESTESAMQAAQVHQSSSIGNIQITGLHTANPLIAYNGVLLSCQWATSIGTDLIFARPESSMDPPLRTLPLADLVGISSAKLMATSARLRPRDEVIDQIVLPGKNLIEIRPTAEDDEFEPEAMVTRVPPTSFLDKLNQAKAKRSDKTRLGVVKTPHGTPMVINVPASRPTNATQTESTTTLTGDTPQASNGGV